MSRAVILGRPVNGQFASEPSPWRKALVVAALPVALFAAVVVQLTVVNRLPLPGGTAPDLVLLLVTAVAVSTGPMTGLLTGFAGGLALDIAPPATHYAGEYALVFCLAGYFAARIAAASAATTGERNPWVELGAMAAATAAGEAGKAGLGLLLSDPDVTGPAIKHVLPGAIAWDLLLTPFAFFLVSWVAGLARPVAERAPRPEFVGAQRLAAVFRLASAGAAPNLRLAGSGRSSPTDRPARRVPKLRLADARSRSLVRTDPGGSGTAPPTLAGGRTAKLNFAPLRLRAPIVRGRRHQPRPDPQAQLRRQVVRPHPAPHPEGPRQGLDPRRRPARDHAAPQPEGPRQGLDPRRRPPRDHAAARPAGPGQGLDPLPRPLRRQGLRHRGRPGHRGRGPPVAEGRLAAHRRAPAPGRRQPRPAGQGLAPQIEATARELVLKRPVDPLGAPFPQQGPVADPAPVAVGRAAVRRP